MEFKEIRAGDELFCKKEFDYTQYNAEYNIGESIFIITTHISEDIQYSLLTFNLNKEHLTDSLYGSLLYKTIKKYFCTKKEYRRLKLNKINKRGYGI